MGRRKEPHTLEEYRAEKAYIDDQIRKLENQIALAKNVQSREERKLRTRRLCREAGTLEHFVPELKDMAEETANQFLQAIATGAEAEQFLQERGIRK